MQIFSDLWATINLKNGLIQKDRLMPESIVTGWKEALMKSLFYLSRSPKPYTLATDASKYVWSAVLGQKYSNSIVEQL